jgi:hypothetical protein
MVKKIVGSQSKMYIHSSIYREVETMQRSSGQYRLGRYKKQQTVGKKCDLFALNYTLYVNVLGIHTVFAESVETM